MAKDASFEVIAFLALVACGAMCQDRQATRLAMPDAPSSTVSREMVNAVPRGYGATPLGRESVTVATFVPAGGYASNLIADLMGVERRTQTQSGDFFVKHLFSPQGNMSYHPLAEGSLVGRASFAASRTFITRDASGKGKLNTSYFLGVLTSALAHTANRPYWRRSVGEPFSDFGSTVGNDAGMNLWHEFGPQIQQVMKSHTPRFVEKMEESFARR